MFQRQIENGFARETPLHHDGIRPLFVHGGKRRGELLLAADHDRLDCNAQGAAALLDVFNERPGEWIACTGQHGHAPRGRQHLADEFEGFC